MPAVVLDLDGVVWLGDEPLPGAAGAVARFRAAGLDVGFVTNNSSLPVEGYVEKLGGFGVAADPSEVLTSALAAADLLAADLAPGSRVLACSGPGVVEALEAKGFEVVGAGPADAVVVGWHRTFDFDRLDRASAAIRAGARFVATNTDATYPAPDGLLPGNGSLVAAVATASGRRPEVAGKPEPPMVAMVRNRFGDRGVMAGDRPSTDGALAAGLGWPFALVLSAATRSGDEAADPRADFVGGSLAEVAGAVISALSAGGQ
ncbi:MAG TPA: HAD-IIA family hydrolase [Acidimicrobiia bacterium]|nr:HAD-IIA family hydrolase [Acidimicrobiia bacterium]